jgi:ABC-2 type transport system ATP-binding protein
VNGEPDAVLECREVYKSFGPRAPALAGVSLAVPAGRLSALVGPDGAGKTTLMRLACGLFSAERGTVRVLGFDPAIAALRIQERVSYMPQKFGLYEDLTVRENLDLYADLHGVSDDARAQRYPQLLHMTDLARFERRLAGRLSGGMKQKLALACTLVGSPQLLLLDEPTVGVDPLSRRELWQIVSHLVREQGLTVLMSTAYLDEAERADRVIVLQAGRVLAEDVPQGVIRLAAGRTFKLTPSAPENARRLQARLLASSAVIDAVPDGGAVRCVCTQADGPPAQGLTPVAPRFEDGFMVLLRRSQVPERPSDIVLSSPPAASSGALLEVRELVKRFGAFTAVDRVSFSVGRGEIFGLLGPNGAGKTTTFRMLCGLLAPSGGVLRVGGLDVGRAGDAARGQLGYVAQKFSLYGPLSVRENLEFFASAYGLRGARRRERIEWAIRQFDLTRAAGAAADLPGGFKQRLALAAALLHEPRILFLDEPTSGADALARRAFWRRISALADQGVTVVVTTHFMPEAEYCDHIVIMDSGRVLAQGTPAQVRALAPRRGELEPTMEEAFIAVVERSRAAEAPAAGAA